MSLFFYYYIMLNKTINSLHEVAMKYSINLVEEDLTKIELLEILLTPSNFSMNNYFNYVSEIIKIMEVEEITSNKLLQSIENFNFSQLQLGIIYAVLGQHNAVEDIYYTLLQFPKDNKDALILLSLHLVE